MPNDIRVLMVTDGTRFNFGPRQSTTAADPSYFGVTQLLSTLTGSTTPTISVYTAHRRRAAILAVYPQVAAAIDYPEDFLFTGTAAHPVDLSQYDVIWIIADEGINGAPPVATTDQKLTNAEIVALGNFMDQGGGVFAVGDHDGIGSYLCRMLPRIRTMRKWSFTGDTDPDAGADYTGQTFAGNWSALGSATSGPNDRFDTLRADAADGLYYFVDQSDGTPQPVLTATGTPIATSPTLHAILRGTDGTVIASFPDHMHEGEATDFAAVSTGATFNPNDGSGNPHVFPATGRPEFPKNDISQPLPEVIAWGQDLGHASLAPPVGVTNPKIRGIVAVYDGRAANVGRIVTGSTFHHYLDKNLVGDPMTSNPPGSTTGPTGTNTGLPPAVLGPIGDYYINTVAWLAKPNPNFYFVVNKNIFGLDEMQSATGPDRFPSSFYLVFDGIPSSVVGTNPAIVLSGPLIDAGMTYQKNAPQVVGNRVIVSFDVLSIPTSAFPAAMSSTELTLEATISLGGNFYAAETVFELTGGANPYFTNVDPTQNNVFYLSQDLRVFNANPGSAPFATFNPGDPHGYAAALVNALNNNPSFTSNTTGMDPFTTLHAANDLTEDTSVDPSQYFFAVARVRLKPGGTVPPTVRVFFRLFATQSNDTDYAPESTYLSTFDSSGLPATPLPGTQNSTYPMFATAGGSGDYPGVNTVQLTVPTTGESWAYFACYLDFSVSPPLPGSHHCLVAQLAYDGAPIINSNGITLSPENSDKLAQRNLQISSSGNPGGPAAHRVPQTFDTRTSVRSAAPATALLGYPDELMITWGDVPRGTKANIFWPGARAADVARLSMMLYGGAPLTIVDANTVQCTVDAPVSYLPIPFGAGDKLAGLFTIDLPQGIRAGQEFHVVVRRISTRQPPQLLEAKVRDGASEGGGKREHITRDWRYVVGTFQVTIPVAMDEALLPAEENLLSIMSWRLLQTPVSNRWYRVLERYVDIIAGRVNAFGGNAGGIVPSPVGLLPPPGGTTPFPCGDLVEHTGKVYEVVFDCFGELEGFVLEGCCERFSFRARERAVGDLLLRACRDRLTLTVYARRGPGREVSRIVVRG